jgi:hypothetical protein
MAAAGKQIGIAKKLKKELAGWRNHCLVRLPRNTGLQTRRLREK